MVDPRLIINGVIYSKNCDYCGKIAKRPCPSHLSPLSTCQTCSEKGIPCTWKKIGRWTSRSPSASASGSASPPLVTNESRNGRDDGLTNASGSGGGELEMGKDMEMLDASMMMGGDRHASFPAQSRQQRSKGQPIISAAHIIPQSFKEMETSSQDSTLTDLDDDDSEEMSVDEEEEDRDQEGKGGGSGRMMIEKHDVDESGDEEKNDLTYSPYTRRLRFKPTLKPQIKSTLNNSTGTLPPNSTYAAYKIRTRKLKSSLAAANSHKTGPSRTRSATTFPAGSTAINDTVGNDNANAGSQPNLNLMINPPRTTPYALNHPYTRKNQTRSESKTPLPSFESGNGIGTGESSNLNMHGNGMGSERVTTEPVRPLMSSILAPKARTKSRMMMVQVNDDQAMEGSASRSWSRNDEEGIAFASGTHFASGSKRGRVDEQDEYEEKSSRTKSNKSRGSMNTAAAASVARDDQTKKTSGPVVQARGRTGRTIYWTEEEHAELWEAIYQLAKKNVNELATLPNMKANGRCNARIHTKLDGLFKKPPFGDARFGQGE